MYFVGRPLPAADRLLARAPRRGRGARRARPRGGPARDATATRPRTWRRCATPSSTRWPTTSTPRAALASLFDWIREANRRDGPVGDAHLREMLAVLGLDNLLDAAAGPPPELVELARAARAGARGAATSPRPTGCATSCAPRAGRSATARTARSSCRWRDRLRAQPGPRGAARPAGGAADLGGQRADWSGAPVTHATRRGDRRALRLGRPPGRLRGGRGLPLRRRRRAARARPSRSSSRSTRSPTRRTSARSAARPRSPARPAWSSPSAAPPR